MVRRRGQLEDVFDLFDDMLENLREDPSLITSRLAVQTMFVFRLMRYGCSFVHTTSDGPQKLMVISEGSPGERRYSFVFRAAWMLRQIWTSPKSIASRIRLDPRQSNLPDDIYGFIVVSRWALARAYLEAKKSDAKAADGKASLLTLSLSRIGKEIYAATVAMGRVDAKEERQTISEMDSDLGCTAAQTEELMRCLHDFAAGDEPKPTATQTARRAA